MKQIVFLLLSLPLISLAQDSTIDLGLDGKDVTQFSWDDHTVTFVASNGRSAYAPRGKNFVIKTIDASSGTTLNTFKTEDGIDLDFHSKYGYYIYSGAQGAIINPFGGGGTKYNFVSAEGKSLGKKKFDDKDLFSNRQINSTYMLKNRLVNIAPKDKGYKLGKKYKGKKEVVWLIYQMDLTTLEEKITPLNLPHLTGKEHLIGYTLLEVNEEGFSLVAKNFSNSNDGDSDNQQDLVIYTYNFKGEQQGVTTLSLQIDNSAYEYTYAGLKGGTITDVSPQGISYRAVRPPATGTIYLDKENQFYYVVALLKGVNKNKGMYAYINKFSFDGQKLWEVKRQFMETAPRDKEIKYLSFSPTITKDAIYFMESYVAYKKRKNISVVSLSPVDGSVISENVYEKLIFRSGRGETWHDVVGGYTIKELFGENIYMDEETVILYSTNSKVKSFLENVDRDREQYIYSQIAPSGDIYIHQNNYKDQQYKLLTFLK